ncbi:30504_t:CDS:1, partial [Racocetra persica]
ITPLVNNVLPYQRQQGFYVTRAYTNCQQKHAKCMGEATCERCILRGLECTFIDSGKKRGPKINGKHTKRVYIFNGLENDFDGTSTQFLMPCRITHRLYHRHLDIPTAR